MFRKIFVSLVSIFAFASISFAQNVPDLSSKNWEFMVEGHIILGVDLGNGQEAGLPVLLKLYNNETETISASVLMWKNEEVVMVFGTKNDYLFAIKVGNNWYVAKTKNINALDAVAIYGNDGKPTGVKLSLETTDGLKELILSFN